MRGTETVQNNGGVDIIRVDGGEMKNKLKWFRSILKDAYGPWGLHQILQPQMGGAITRTKHTHQILELLEPHHPLLKVMIAHLQAHGQCYVDSTLYAGILATK